MTSPKLFIPLVALIFSLTQPVFSQTGPGGVGNATGANGQPQNVLWLKSDVGITSSGGFVDTWADQSGNSNNAVGSGATRPTYNATDANFNGLPSITFPNTAASIFLLQVPDNDNLDNTSAFTAMVVMRPTSNVPSTTLGVLSKRTGLNVNQSYSIDITTGPQYRVTVATSAASNLTNATALNQNDIIAFVMNGSTKSGFLDGTVIGTAPTGAAALPNTTSNLFIGSYDAATAAGLEGQLVEVILYRTSLNTAQRQIVENYLSSKYNSTLASGDVYVGDTGGNGNHDYDVVGIGFNGGTSHVSANSKGFILTPANNSVNANGEFVLAGHNNVTNAVSVANLGTSVQQRWARTWYIDETPGTGVDANITFDLSEGIGGQFPQNKDNYVLLRYDGSNYQIVSGITNSDKAISGDQITFTVTDANLVDGIYTLGTIDAVNSPVNGVSNRTWYSYASSNWGDPNSWTLDGGLFPLLVNPSSETPGLTDNVVITSGKTITMNISNVQVNSIDVQGTLDLASTTGHNFNTISGDGRIRISGTVDNFPLGTVTDFASASIGGTLEIYGTGISLDQARTFNDIEINMNNASDVAVLMNDLIVNGDLTISNGIFKINNDVAITNRSLTISGDLSIASTGAIRTGNTNSRHELNLYGDFSNNGGTVYFTQRTSAITGSDATDGIVDFNLLSATSDQSVVCDGETRFYRIEINKGVDDTYKASISASSVANFNLFGRANYDINEANPAANGNGSNLNALGLNVGTVEVGSNVIIDNLNTVSNYSIYEGAQLWVNGGSVTKPSGTAIVPYGKVRVSSGSLTANINSGLTLRDDGIIQIDGGTLTAQAIRTSTAGAGAVGSYIQSGGDVILTGGAVSNDYAVFSLTYTGNVFSMSGGTLTVQNRNSLGTGSLRGAIFINSDPSNTSITGGTVIMEADNAISYRVTSRSSFWNVILRGTGGARALELLGTTTGTGGGANEPSLAIQPLVVLNDFTIENNANFTTNDANVTISGSLEIANGGTYVHGANTTTLSGAGVTSLVFGNTATTQTFNNLTINKTNSTDEVTITTGNATALRVNGTLTITNGILDYSTFIVSARGTVSLASGVTVGKSTGTGRITMDGTADQTLNSTNAAIYNLELNNTDASPVITLGTDNLTVYGTLTMTSGIFNINIYKLTLNGASASIAGTGFGVSKMIQTAGNASDGGLEMYFNAAEAITYPIGTNANASTRYTPAIVQISTFTDDGLIKISIEDALLQIVNLPATNSISYNWRLSHTGFTTLPTVSHRFTYDESDINGANDNSYVAGKVLTVSPFTRSAEEGSDFDDPGNVLTYNGASTGGTFPGTGFTLSNAAFTAGASGLFTGAPTVYYNRENGVTGWNDNNKWSLAGFNGTATNQQPGTGDVVMLKNTDGSSDQNSWVNMDVNVSVAAIIFDNSGGGWLPRVTVTNGTTVSLGVVSGTGEIMVEANGSLPTLNSTDIGDFAIQTASMFIYKVENNATYTMYPAFIEYPNLRIEGNDGANNNGLRVMRNTVPITVNRDLWMDWGGTFRAEANVTIGRHLRPGVGGGGGGRFQFGENGSHTVTVTNDVLSVNSANNRIEVINTTPNTRAHTLKVGGNITQTTGIIDLYNGTGTANNAILEVNGSTTASYTNASGNTPDLFRLVVNKGTSIGTTFTLSDNMTLNGPFDQTTKPLVLQNGLLIIDDPAISYTLTSGGADFSIPGTAGLEVKQGSVATSTTSTNANITLDGLLRVSGGTVDINGGGASDTNYIEYSNSGNAAIEVTGGSLTVAGQIRRQLTSNTGVLKYTQSNGTVLVGNESAGTTTRGVFEVLNAGSQFNHTGGNFTIVRGINSSTVPSLWLEPASSTITGSTITIGNTSTPSGVNSQNIGIQSTVALNNLTIAGSNSPVAKIYISPLTVNGNVIVSSSTTLNANAQDLTIGGNFTVDGSYVNGNNTTTFTNTAAAAISGATPLLSFYNFTKNGAGTLTVLKDITINNDLRVLGGIFSTGSFSVNLKGNAQVDATISSTSGSGLIFSGSSQQQLTRSSAGTGTLGIVTINNSLGVIVPDGNGYNFDVTSNLRLQQGVFDIGGSLLFLQINALITPVNAFSVSNMIQTNSSFTDFGVRKQFPTGYTTDFIFPVGQLLYTPVTFKFSGVGQTTGSTLTPTITVRPANERHPTIVEDAEAPDPEITDIQNVLQYHWIINADNVSSTFVSEMNLTYSQSLVSVTAPYSESDYIPARILSDGNPGGNINKYSVSDVNTTSNILTFTFTSVGDALISGEYFAGVDDAIPNTVPTYTVIANGNVGDLIYSPAVPSGGVPSGAFVIVPSPFTLTLNSAADNVSFYKLEIQSGATVTIASGSIGNRLGTLSGTGNLRVEGPTPVLPAAVYDDFFSCTGGGLVYAGTGFYEILGGITSLRNLTIEGTGSRTLGGNDVTICNNLVISDATLNTNGRNISVGNDLSILSGAFSNTAGNLTISNDFIQSGGSFTGGFGGTKTIGRDLIISGGTFTAGFSTSNVYRVNRNMTVANSPAVTFTGGTSSATGVRFTFQGTSLQTLTGTFTSTRFLNRLEINNSAGLQLGGNVTVESTLILTNGTITTGSYQLLLNSNATASPSSGSATSFISGKLYKVVPTTGGFTFPIGKGALWRPASVSGLSAAGDTWDAEYFYSPATSEALVNNLTPVAPILTVAQGEYWKISDGAAIGRTAKIGLSWGTESDVSATLAQREALQVVVWNDGLTRWDNYGGTNFSAGHTQASGTFNSSSSISFSENIVTLGSTEAANPLPVDLISFAGVNQNGFNKLDWKTASELNNDYFELQRSNTGEEFLAVTKIQGKGTTNDLTAYTFVDEQPYAGKNYYRLKQVDFNGNFEYSNIILVTNDVEDVFNISVFPNPASKEASITIRTLKGDEYEATVHITDMTGRTLTSYVIHGEGSFEQQVDVSTWGEVGIYLVEMRQGSKRVFKRLMLN